MARSIHRGLSERQLRWWLLAFFCALSIPAALLVYRAYDQLKWEVFHQYRVSAEQVSLRIDTELRRLIEAEEARSFSDYSFPTISGDNASVLAQQSPLSQFPVVASLPGLFGYFQVDSAGQMSSPTLPKAGSDLHRYGILENEYQQRTEFNARLKRILDTPENDRPQFKDQDSVAKQKAEPRVRALASPPDDQVTQYNVFDRLAKAQGSIARQAEHRNLGRVDDLKLDARLEKKSRQRVAEQEKVTQFGLSSAMRASRKEQVAVYEYAESVADSEAGANIAAAPAIATPSELVLPDSPIPRRDNTRPSAEPTPAPELTVRFFESEIDPLSFDQLDDDYFVLYRNVWRGGERFIQGAVVERDVFLDATIRSAFLASPLSSMSELLVAYKDNVVSALSGATQGDKLSTTSKLSGELLYRTRLSAPLSELELIFSVTSLPLGAGARYLVWLALLLALVLCGGCFVIYRYGLGQLSLYRQQQDFVSAVSHELKTPLTSIRMYSEMLKAGWADEEKKATYYDFIHAESERLSRLIANVLQLSRITRGTTSLDTKAIRVGELIDITRSKIASQVEHAEFELHYDVDEHAQDAGLQVDIDGFTQIMINLVDNAIKFAPKNALRQIDIGCALKRDGSVRFTVRDFGAGVAKDQMRRIFELFYRSESELTRETIGTGIGLALVHELATTMGGRIDVQNRDPGAEFSLTFPVATA